MAMFADVLNPFGTPADTQEILVTDSIFMRDKFRKWLTDGKARKYTTEVLLSCIDRISEYAVQKKISVGCLWGYTNHSVFNSVYRKLIETKMLRITDRNTHKMFIVAGKLYLRFLKEKPLSRKEAVVATVKEFEQSDIVHEQIPKRAIDPEDVVTWLITQPSANGTVYLENVVRQYMGTLRTTPAKLDISIDLDVRSVFNCRTPDTLNTYWEIAKSAPNYKQVNSSTSGMFSAALSCYMRYLKYLTTDVQEDEPISSHNAQSETEVATIANNPNKGFEFKRVDFNCPERYVQTKPTSCTINGQSVVMSKQNWSQLLVAITEWFIAVGSLNLESLNRKPLYGSKAFFLPQKAEFGTCAELSSGKWIYTNYNPQTIVAIIKNLCQHCGVDLSDVVIRYEAKDRAPIQTIQTFARDTYAANVISQNPAPDPAVAVKITDVLAAHFSNGYRLNSPIEMMRFRSFAADDFKAEIVLTDEELKNYIAMCGTNYDDKVYVVSLNVKERIKELVDDYFAEGAECIFYAEFYAKNESWLFEASIVSEDMLIEIFRRIFLNLSFTQTYFGYTDTSVFTALENEILRVWGFDVLLTYGQLAERLRYIPLERIKYALGQNSDFIWSSVETFSHISQIEIAEEEQEAIRVTAMRKCNASCYVSITDLPFGEIKERNCELSITAVHSAVYRICLSDKFDKKGKIVTRKGDVFDALTILKEYCRTIDKCSLDDLLDYEKELTGEVHRWIPMEAGNAVLVRVEKESYVADRYVKFNVDHIDGAIDMVVKDNYLPLISFTTFGAFPDCGLTWNLFLLESYCRRFSQKFRFDSLSVNSRNSGAIIRKSCNMDYTEMMADAVANSCIPLKNVAVGQFLFDSGYIGRRMNAKVTEVINTAKTIRERRD